MPHRQRNCRRWPEYERSAGRFAAMGMVTQEAGVTWTNATQVRQLQATAQ